MAALEGGMAAVATSSGQAASALTITSLTSVGNKIVASYAQLDMFAEF